MRNLAQWLAGERAEILARRAAIAAGFAGFAGWELLGCGAYFAYARHPFGLPSDQLAQRLVAEAGVLLLPGTMFTPDGDPGGPARTAHRLRQYRHRRDCRAFPAAGRFSRLSRFAPRHARREGGAGRAFCNARPAPCGACPRLSSSI